MYIFNTTFVVSDEIRSAFIDWIKTNYVHEATASGKLSQPMLMLIGPTEDPGYTGYALQLKAETKADIEEWEAGKGGRLKQSLAERHGHAVLYFSTIMEEIAL